MITIVLWLWKDPLCRNQYKPEHVNRAVELIHKNLSMEHKFVLFTDYLGEGAMFDDLIETWPLWDDWHLLKTPLERWQRKFPQCYVRLKAFSKEFASVVGPRYVSIDLDFNIHGALDPLFDRTEDFVIVKSTDKGNYGEMNGSMWMMITGSRPSVWEDFHGMETLQKLPQDLKYHITDQGWLLYKLGPDEAGWNEDDGVYLWPWLKKNGKKVPENARIVFYNGAEKPW